MGNINLTDYIDVDMLQRIQDMYVESTHMNTCILDSEGEKVTVNSKESVIYDRYIINNKNGMDQFLNSEKMGAMKALIDEETYVYKCFTGMTKLSTPILIKGQYVGSISAGEVMTEPVDEELCHQLAEELDIDYGDFYKSMCSIPVVSENDIKKAVKMADMTVNLIQSIAKSNLLYKQQIDEIQMVADSQMNYVSEISVMMENAVSDIVKEAEEAASGSGGKSGEAFNKIKKAANGLAESIEDTIEYAKYSDWQLNNNDYNFNVEQMIDIVCGTAKRKLADRDWKLAYEVRCDEETVLMGDAGCISQVINKLIGYCVDYLSADNVWIDVDCDKKGYATFLNIRIKAKMADMNTGISSKIHDNTDFKELSAMSVVDTDNTQISIVGNLVRHMNGNIEFKVSDGCITDFLISVPLLSVNKAQ